MQVVFNLGRKAARYRVVALLLVVLVSACSSVPREYAAPPAEQYQAVQIPGYQDIRFWGDEKPPQVTEQLARQKRLLATNPAMFQHIDILALSGGGEDGAYGAGVLKGWSERGDRPVFTMVTGISTGALIAPFAFLGSQYDDAIKRFYTETSRRDIVLLTPLKALFGGSSLGDSAPLRRLLHEEINPQLVAALAAESRKGRMLFIGTTDLDAQRPVIWNIGRIAESGNPQSAELIASIMLASASIPGVFPPVSFDVTIHGKAHQEVHVDGGVTNQIFVYPPDVNREEIEQSLGVTMQKNLWLIRNSKITPEYEAVDMGVASISKRSISTLIKYQGLSNLLALQGLAQRDGFAFHLTSVPPDFRTTPKMPFDKNYMRDLYVSGYQAGLAGNLWRNEAYVSPSWNSKAAVN